MLFVFDIIFFVLLFCIVLDIKSVCFKEIFCIFVVFGLDEMFFLFLDGIVKINVKIKFIEISKIIIIVFC